MKILAIALIFSLQLIFSTSAQELKPLVPVDEPISEQLQVVLADPTVQAAMQRIQERESIAVEEQLVFKTAQRLGLFNQKSDYRVLIDCDNITQLGLAIEDDVVILI